MDAELLVAGESLEMLTGLPKTLGAGELGEVTVLITESKLRVDRSALGLHSYGFPAATVKEKTLAQLLHLVEAGSGRFWQCDDVSGNVDCLRQVVRYVDRQVCGKRRGLREEDRLLDLSCTNAMSYTKSQLERETAVDL